MLRPRWQFCAIAGPSGLDGATPLFLHRSTAKTGVHGMSGWVFGGDEDPRVDRVTYLIATRTRVDPRTIRANRRCKPSLVEPVYVFNSTPGAPRHRACRRCRAVMTQEVDMMEWMNGGVWTAWGWVLAIPLFGLIVLAVAMLARGAGGDYYTPRLRTSLQLLQDRYIRGEIDRAEYDRQRSDLDES